jgi:hypothetical protein
LRLQEAIEACPVDCIHSVTFAELEQLEGDRQHVMQPRTDRQTDRQTDRNTHTHAHKELEQLEGDDASMQCQTHTRHAHARARTHTRTHTHTHTYRTSSTTRRAWLDVKDTAVTQQIKSLGPHG